MKKRVLALLLAVLLIFCLFGCSKKATEELSDEESSAVEEADENNNSEQDNIKENETDNSESKNQTAKETGKNKTSSKKSSSSDSGNAANEAGINMDKLKGTTVKLLMWRPLTDQEKKTINNFQNNTGIKVKVTTDQHSTYMVKLSSLIAANDAPDVAIIATEEGSQGCFPLGAASLYQPAKVSKQDFTDPFWDLDSMNQFKIKGNYYAFISYGSWYNCNGIVLYNADMFAKYGITTPKQLWKSGNWNWDTLKSTAQAIKKKGSIGYFNHSRYNLMHSACTDFVTYNGKTFTSEITGNKVIKSWTFNSQMVELGLQPKYGTETQSFYEGKTAMVGINLWTMRKEAMYGNVSFKLDAAPFPSPKGQSAVLPGGANLFAIPKGSKNPVGGGVFIRDFIDAKNNGSFADVAVNPEMEEVFNYCTSKNNKKYYGYANGVVGYTNIANLTKLMKDLSETSSSQITTVLQKNKSLMDNAVNNVNKKLN